MAHPLAGLTTTDAINAFINSAFGHGWHGGNNPAANPDPPETNPRRKPDELEVPIINSFLQTAKTTTEGYGERRTDVHFVNAGVEARQRDMDNRSEVGKGAMQWMTAAEPHFGDILYSAHLDGD